MVDAQKLSLKQIFFVFVLSICLGYWLVNWFTLMVPAESYWPLGVDIYPSWVGSRAVWQGKSPYTTEVDLETQSYIYGRSAQEGEDSFAFYYPAYVAVILAPLTLIPARTAALLWTATIWATLSTIAVVTTRSLSVSTPRWLWLVTLFSILLHRIFLLSVINGQYVILILAVWGAAYYFIQREQEMVAGSLLALTTIKPSLSFIPLVLWLIWLFTSGRKRTLIFFCLTSGILFAISLFQIGWWVPEFLAQLTKYDQFPRDWHTGNLFTLPGIVWLAGTLALLYFGGKAYWRERIEFPWVLFWGGISLNLLFTPHTWDYDLALMILPFVIYAPRYLQTKSSTVVWLCLFWLPWLTWFAFTYLGYTTDLWVFWLWRFYPQVLVVALLLFLYQNQNSLRARLDIV